MQPETEPLAARSPERFAIWPIHRRGALWSYAMARVPAGCAFVPMEVGLARVMGTALGLAAALAVVGALAGLGVDAFAAGDGLLALGFGVATGWAGNFLAGRSAQRRLERIATDPVAASRKRGAFVIPEGASISTTETRRGGRAVVEWVERGKPRKAVLTVPANVLRDFAELWKTPWDEG